LYSSSLNGNSLAILDKYDHASIIDGCKLAQNDFKRYPHNDMKALELLLHCNMSKEKLIIVDGVFSMEGDIADLPTIISLAEKYNARVMVDDAHGEGVLGDFGRGIVDYFHLEGKVDIDVGTLSKAFGVVGGYVAGSKVLIEYMKQRARPFLFSTPMSPADAAALIKVVDILSKDDFLVKKLWEMGII